MAQTLSKSESHTYPPAHLYIGLGLALFFWFASWTRLGILGEYAFFPQWLGYILTVDGIIAWRKGESLLTAHPREWMALFVLSAPIWWVFEGLNEFVQNWHYITGRPYSPIEYILIATIDFSTVVPAVFETATLLLTFEFIQRRRDLPRFNLPASRAWLAMFGGAAAFAAVVLVPRYAFPFTWVWLVLIVDPLNYLRERPSLLAQAAQGDGRRLIALALGALVCGFFWEMWNSHAMPKWYYTVPFVGFGKVFEMPILGYFGYIPFAWELYALYQMVWGRLGRVPKALEATGEAVPEIDNQIQSRYN